MLRRGIFRPLFIALLSCCSFLSSSSFAASAEPSRIALKDRIYIASQIYAGLANFAHFQGASEVDVDSAYRAYLDKVLASDSRKDFSLASMQFLASLHNGHTVLFDRQLVRETGPLPFVAKYIRGQWVVTESLSTDLKAGDVIDKIDGRPFEEFYSQLRPYISASSESGARNVLFSQVQDFAPFAPLFPEKFQLTLSRGREITIDRHVLPMPVPPKTEGRWLEPGKLAYIRVPSFFYPENEKRAIELVHEFGQAPAMIVDVRGNFGGGTPSDLIAQLMDRPHRWWSESTPVTMPYFRYRATQGVWQYQPFKQPQIVWQSGWEAAPKEHFSGKLVVLVDGGCYSACEDFTMPFKDNHRAIIVGETTSGSTGQPWVTELNDGILLLIGTKRAIFPDGMPFEGVGIKPDIECQPSIDDIGHGRDPVLEAARRALGN
jgi:carboxyl-terminal processing protease